MTFKQSEIIERFLNYFHKVLEDDYYLITELAINLGNKINKEYISNNLSVEIYKEYIESVINNFEIKYVHNFFVNLGLFEY